MAFRPRSDDPQEATRRLVTDADRAPLPVWIRVLSARAKPTHFRLARGSCVLGAGTAADIVVQDDTVSRSHAELTLVPEGVSVRDLGSSNGTHYLGHKIGTMTLPPGSRLQLGRVEIAIDPDLDSLPDDAPLSALTPDRARVSRYRGIIGASPAMRRLFAMLTRLEGSLVNVLIEGESGTGKEIIARALHEGSSVASGPLVVMNCGSISPHLVQSELFGHRRGAFTGATENRVGAFEAADGGTLFLDEVGELPLDAQPALLRALESGEVRPVGEVQSRRAKVRVIAATNRDLEKETRAGRFREDLYYRIAVVKLAVPPLRDRPEDIEALATHFASAAGVPALPQDVIAELRQHHFPGNARELRNGIQSYLAIGSLPFSSGPRPGSVPPGPTLPELETAFRRLINPKRPYADQKDEMLNRFARVYLELLLAHTHGNQSEASRISGLDRSYIGKLVARYGIPKG